jgi:hypothetical protein
MSEASRELLASREDVWRFLAEPYHLADWWPGVVGVEPDRRGFAAGARWSLAVIEEPLAPRLSTRRSSGSRVAATLLVRDVALYEEWTWSLIRRRRSLRALRTIDVKVRLKANQPDRTLVSVTVGGADASLWLLFGSRRDELTARAAVNRLHDLIQTAATL